MGPHAPDMLAFEMEEELYVSPTTQLGIPRQAGDLLCKLRRAPARGRKFPSNGCSTTACTRRKTEAETGQSVEHRLMLIRKNRGIRA